MPWKGVLTYRWNSCFARALSATSFADGIQTLLSFTSESALDAVEQRSSAIKGQTQLKSDSSGPWLCPPRLIHLFRMVQAATHPEASCRRTFALRLRRRVPRMGLLPPG
jgi:hypothetical protein